MRTIQAALRFMTSQERLKFMALIFARSIISILDLFGVLAIGLLATSIALFVTQGSDPNRKIQIGQLSVDAVNAQSLPGVAVAILLLFVSKAVLSVFLTKKLSFFLATVEARSAKTVAKKMMDRGISISRNHTNAELIYAVQTGSQFAFNYLLNSLGTLIAESFLFLIVILAFLFVNTGVAMMALAYFAIIAFAVQMVLGKVMHRTSKELILSTNSTNEVLLDLGEVLREVKILGVQAHYFDRVFKFRMMSAGNSASQYVLNGMPRYIVETSLIVAIAGFILSQSTNGDIAGASATVGVFLSGGLRLTAALLPLQSAFLTIRQSISPAQSALDVLQTPDELLIPKPGNTLAGSPASVEAEDVSFRYVANGKPTLSNISFKIEAGAQAAFIGESGAGKSTLADLILGLLKPESGSIKIAGIDSAYVLEENHGILGFVPQRPGMVSGSILQNVALGLDRETVDLNRLARAIDFADLGSLIDSLPDGVDTDIGKRKDELSGGQLQRIGLARALYAEPNVLILDEATSALDSESESRIRSTLEKLRGEVTVIIIAHRLNTVQSADVVFLLEDGRISAEGSLRELLKSNADVKNFLSHLSIKDEK